MDTELDGILESFWDAPVSDDEVRKCIAGLKYEWLVTDEDARWRGDQSIDFYKGILAMMRFTKAVFEHVEDREVMKKTVGVFMTKVIHILGEKFKERDNP